MLATYRQAILHNGTQLSRAANAKSNNSRIGKYDNNISGAAHKIFITGGMEGTCREQQMEGGREGEEQSERERGTEGTA